MKIGFQDAINEVGSEKDEHNNYNNDNDNNNNKD